MAVFHSYLKLPEGTPRKNMNVSVGILTIPMYGQIENDPDHQPNLMKLHFQHPSSGPMNLRMFFEQWHLELVTPMKRQRQATWVPSPSRLSCDNQLKQKIGHIASYCWVNYNNSPTLNEGHKRGWFPLSTMVPIIFTLILDYSLGNHSSHSSLAVPSSPHQHPRLPSKVTCKRCTSRRCSAVCAWENGATTGSFPTTLQTTNRTVWMCHLCRTHISYINTVWTVYNIV